MQGQLLRFIFGNSSTLENEINPQTPVSLTSERFLVTEIVEISCLDSQPDLAFIHYTTAISGLFIMEDKCLKFFTFHCI